MEGKEEIIIDKRLYWSGVGAKRYLTLDFSYLKSLEIFELILKAHEVACKEEIGSVNILTDLTGVDLSFSTFSALKQLSKEMQKYLKKSGIIGVDKKLAPFYKMYVAFTKSKALLVKDKEEYLAYLVSK